MLLKHGSNDQIGSKWIKIGSNFQIGLEWIELTLSKLIELDQTGSNWIKLHQTLSLNFTRRCDGAIAYFATDIILHCYI